MRMNAFLLKVYKTNKAALRACRVITTSVTFFAAATSA